MKTLIAALLLIGAVGTLQAQQIPEDELGVVFFLDYNMHTSEFKGIPNIPSCCPDYTYGDAFAYSVGIVYEHPVDRQWSMSARLLLADRSAQFVEEEELVLSVDNAPSPGTFEHRLDATLLTVGLEPVLYYSLTNRLSVGIGANFGFLIVQDYEQKEQITSPENAVFTQTMTATRNEFSGEIENARGLMYGAVAVVRMKIPLGGGGFSLHPEISYNYTFSNLIDGLSWKPHAFRAGVAIQTPF